MLNSDRPRGVRVAASHDAAVRAPGADETLPLDAERNAQSAFAALGTGTYA